MEVKTFAKDKKKPAESQEPTTPEASMGGRLRELCANDEEMYTALSRLLFLDPKKIVSPLEAIIAEAADYEQKGNSLKAEVGYRIAGGLSLWRGDVEGVRKYFGKASMFAGDARPEYESLTKRADEAVSVARKYYETPETASS